MTGATKKTLEFPENLGTPESTVLRCLNETRGPAQKRIVEALLSLQTHAAQDRNKLSGGRVAFPANQYPACLGPVPRGPLSKAARDEETTVRWHVAIMLRLLGAGSIDKFRMCKHCGLWFFRKRVDQPCCTTACRRSYQQTSTEFREKNAAYQREWYRLKKARDRRPKERARKNQKGDGHAKG
jgi:hypothetical protein